MLYISIDNVNPKTQVLTIRTNDKDRQDMEFTGSPSQIEEMLPQLLKYYEID